MIHYAKESHSLFIWMIGDTVELCSEFSQLTGNRDFPSADLDGNVDTKYAKFFYAGGNFWRNVSMTKSIIAKAWSLRYFKEIIQREWINSPIGKHGAIILVDAGDILSVKHGIDTVKFLENLPIPFVIALKAIEEPKSWHNKIKILNDESTLTYDPKDKDSIQRVWIEMIRRFELDAELEQHLLDCIDSNLT